MVLDAEAVAFDRESNKVLPFQVSTARRLLNSLDWSVNTLAPCPAPARRRRFAAVWLLLRGRCALRLTVCLSTAAVVLCPFALCRC